MVLFNPLVAAHLIHAVLCLQVLCQRGNGFYLTYYYSEV